MALRAESTRTERERARSSPALHAELVRALARCARAHELYRTNNRAYRRLIERLRAALERCWAEYDRIELDVDEAGFRRGERRIATEDDGLAALLYREGIRRITLVPGVADEIGAVLECVSRARRSGPDSDDLITLLWQHELRAFRYTYVDQLLGGVVLPEPGMPPSGPPPGPRIEEELESESPPAAPTPRSPAGPAISPDDFEQTLYFLDDDEVDRLREEVEREWRRDVETDVVNALLDRLEDDAGADRAEIVALLGRLLGEFVMAGELSRAVYMLDELSGLLEAEETLSDAAREQAGRIVEVLEDPERIAALLAWLAQADPAEAEAFPGLARHLPSGALAAVARAAGLANDAERQALLRAGLESACRRRAARWIELSHSRDPVIAAEAAAVLPGLGISKPAAHARRLLARPEPMVRRAAIGAAARLRSAQAIGLLEDALEDQDIQIRLAAARGLERLRYAPSRDRLKTVIAGRRLARAATREKLALFRAYAAVAGPGGVDWLAQFALRRSFWDRIFRRSRRAELRACAVAALGTIDSPAARVAVSRAAEDPDPRVRRAARVAAGPASRRAAAAADRAAPPARAAAGT